MQFHSTSYLPHPKTLALTSTHASRDPHVLVRNPKTEYGDFWLTLFNDLLLPLFRQLPPFLSRDINWWERPDLSIKAPPFFISRAFFASRLCCSGSIGHIRQVEERRVGRDFWPLRRRGAPGGAWLSGPEGRWSGRGALLRQRRVRAHGVSGGIGLFCYVESGVKWLWNRFVLVLGFK